MRFLKYISALITVLILPLAARGQSTYDITADVTEGCDSVKVKFTFMRSDTLEKLTNFFWDFGNGQSSTVIDPDTVFYNVPGPYTIILLFGTSESDMLDRDPIIKSNFITVYPSITADFTFTDTIEVGYYAVSFKHKDQPYSNAGIYAWDFGDGETSDQRNVIHNYPGPGTYNVTLRVSNNYGCADSSEQVITLAAPPEMPEITASDTFGCGELRVKFTLGNVDPDTVTSISWDFGNGTTSNLTDPDTVVYNQPGRFDVGVVINGDVTHGVKVKNMIHVQLLSPAEFTFRDTVTYNSIIVEHTGITDTNAIYTYSWDFGEDIGLKTGKRVQVIYEAKDSSYYVKLIVTDNFGCTDSSEDIIYIYSELTVQNVFTPNGDNINDYFEITSHGSAPLVIRIFTRTGTLVYKGEGYTITWDGRTSWGLDLNQGIYYYVLDALENDPDNRYHKTGFIYLYK
jgi:gliding motility-associated-like protein